MKKILIIDDEKSITWMLCEALSLHGFKGVEANNMNDASNFVMCKPDLIFLDLQGGDIERDTIQRYAKRNSIPLVTMSGNDSLKPQLLKPFGIKEFIKKIKEQLK